MVAKIYGYVPMADGETEAGLYAEYEALMGKPLPNRQDELNRIRDDALAKRADRLAHDSDRTGTSGRGRDGQRLPGLLRGPGSTRLRGRGQFYVAYRWIEEAGFQIVYVVPDGSTTIKKALCGPAVTSMRFRSSWPTRMRSMRAIGTIRTRAAVGRYWSPVPLRPKWIAGLDRRRLPRTSLSLMQPGCAGRCADAGQATSREGRSGRTCAGGQVLHRPHESPWLTQATGAQRPLGDLGSGSDHQDATESTVGSGLGRPPPNLLIMVTKE